MADPRTGGWELVRDRCPQHVADDLGFTPAHRIAAVGEMPALIAAKLVDEAREARDLGLDELADLLELLRAGAEHNGHRLTDVIAAAARKRRRVGGFDARVVMDTRDPRGGRLSAPGRRGDRPVKREGSPGAL
jgi:predicted house-cleaning noncanonical NTP pyrophosphatase (MazG superfamily)